MIEPHNPRRWLAALRWGAAALAVTGLHGTAAWYAVHWKPAYAQAAAGAPETAIMIELAAVSVAPEAPPEELPPAPEAAQAEPPPEPVKETPPPEPEPEPPPPEPEPVVEPPPPEELPPPEPTPVQMPEPEIVIPELPSLPDAMAVLAPPPPPEKKVEKPIERKPRPKPKVVERKKIERPIRREAAAPPPAPPQASAPTRDSQGAAASPTVSTASWRGTLIAHLNRYKRFPSGARPGTVQVAFSIDRGGRVLSARLVGSSGDSALDEEAVGMIRRASPVPAPPAGIGGGGAVSLAVPVRFSR
jgi:protein TonB